MNRSIVFSLFALIMAGGVAGGSFLASEEGRKRSSKTDDKDMADREITEYHAPKEDNWAELTDDNLSEKAVSPFDPLLIDRRAIGKGNWQINSSAAVLRLDAPMLLPDRDAQLLTLYPSYSAACKACTNYGWRLLCSVNMIDGKAKQFDDGLYAALDLNYYQGLEQHLAGHVRLIERMLEKVGKSSPAAPYLAAGLEIAGITVDVTDSTAKNTYRSMFQSDSVLSKPIAFYTWSDPLKKTFRFLRYFQRPLSMKEESIQLELAKALSQDAGLLSDYKKALAFYAKLTNPYNSASLLDLVDGSQTEGGKRPPIVAVFPSSGSKEGTLFDRLFGDGVPAEANLMKELIKRIRSGEVDLSPRKSCGWYEHQVYALETLLLANKGQEKDKLVLTKAYKKRMLEAFQALITKRRETHARQFPPMEAMSARPAFVEKFAPRLRIEPNATFYLRTARAYSFLANFLESAVSADGLKKIHGQKQGGERAENLHAELKQMINLFYGMYLISCEDIGLKPKFDAQEQVDQDLCYKTANQWLSEFGRDEDLSADTRVSIPIMTDPRRNVTRLWATLGVRMAKLEVRYVRPPSVRPASGGEWEVVKPEQLLSEFVLIPVDEFAEVELRGMRSLNREEFRDICDRGKTKAAILKELSE